MLEEMIAIKGQVKSSLMKCERVLFPGPSQLYQQHIKKLRPRKDCCGQPVDKLCSKQQCRETGQRNN